jgi:nuclear RNA export factor
MIDDEIVKKYNLSPPGHGGTARDAAVIFKLASQLKPEVLACLCVDFRLLIFS